MPVALAFAFLMALGAGARSGWRTQADFAAEAEAARRKQLAAGGGGPGPVVQGGELASVGALRWFYWYIHYGNLVVPYGPTKQMRDGEAFRLEFSTKFNYPGATFHRYVGERGKWIRDTRKDTEFLASAPIPPPSAAPEAPALPAARMALAKRVPPRRPAKVSGEGDESVSGPIRGDWPYQGLPHRVTLAGRLFERARFFLPYPGVVGQYRETKPHDSAHLFVLENGRFVVPHIDEANPDLGPGLMLEHAVRDLLPALMRQRKRA